MGRRAEANSAVGGDRTFWGQRVRDGEDNQIAQLDAPTWMRFCIVSGAFLQREAHDYRDGEHQSHTATANNGPLPAAHLVCHDDPLRGIPLKGQSLPSLPPQREEGVLTALKSPPGRTAPAGLECPKRQLWRPRLLPTLLLLPSLFQDLNRSSRKSCHLQNDL